METGTTCGWRGGATDTPGPTPGESAFPFAPGRGYGDAQGGGGGPSLDQQKKAQVVSALVAAGWPELADRIKDCGRTARKMRCRSCGAEWIAPDRCHLRLCPDCGQIRALRLYNAHKCLAGQPNLKHLVLTFKNTPTLAWAMIPWMRGCFTRLRNRKLFARSWLGGVYSMEFTYTKAAGFHPHIHALIEGKFVPQAEIAKAWKEITGSAEVVWIARAKRSRQVLKYILKPGGDLLDDPAALDNFLTVIQHRHFVSGWGKWYRVSKAWLMGELTCPICGSADIGVVGKVIWSDYYGAWVERSPPPGELRTGCQLVSPNSKGPY